MTTATDEYLRPADVERQYGPCESTLATWRAETVKTGQQVGPRWIRLGARYIAYRRSAVEAWISECERRSA